MPGNPCVIYLITNLLDGKGYVGQTTDFVRRKKEHWADARGRCEMLIHRAMRKYGRNNFDMQILGEVGSQEEANNLETLWIVTLRTTDREYGYNLTFGGDAFGKRHPDVTARIAAKLRGRKLSPERCKQMSEAQRGHKVSQEARDKISRTLTGRTTRPCPPEVKEKIGAAQRGRKLSEEHKQKMRKPKNLTEERRQQLRDRAGFPPDACFKGAEARWGINIAR